MELISWKALIHVYKLLWMVTLPCYFCNWKTSFSLCNCMCLVIKKVKYEWKELWLQREIYVGVSKQAGSEQYKTLDNLSLSLFHVSSVLLAHLCALFLCLSCSLSIVVFKYELRTMCYESGPDIVSFPFLHVAHNKRLFSVRRILTYRLV